MRRASRRCQISPARIRCRNLRTSRRRWRRASCTTSLACSALNEAIPTTPLLTARRPRRIAGTSVGVLDAAARRSASCWPTRCCWPRRRRCATLGRAGATARRDLWPRACSAIPASSWSRAVSLALVGGRGDGLRERAHRWRPRRCRRVIAVGAADGAADRRRNRLGGAARPECRLAEQRCCAPASG